MEEISAKKPADEAHHSDSSSRSEDVDSSHARPYDCFFCKRGFSTAQALGGHMNIHRKDRFKQKQQPAATNHATSSLYPNPPNVSFSHSVTLKIKGGHSSLTCTNGGESEASRIVRWPWSCYKRDGGPRHEEIDGVRRLRQLPLLVDRSCVGDGHGGERPFRSTTELLTPVAVEEELDLELRLGPTPCGGATGEKRKALHGRQDQG